MPGRAFCVGLVGTPLREKLCVFDRSDLLPALVQERRRMSICAPRGPAERILRSAERRAWRRTGWRCCEIDAGHASHATADRLELAEMFGQTAAQMVRQGLIAGCVKAMRL